MVYVLSIAPPGSEEPTSIYGVYSTRAKARDAEAGIRSQPMRHNEPWTDDRFVVDALEMDDCPEPWWGRS